MPVLVSGVALMAGALASSEAQAQCEGFWAKYSKAGAVSSLVSMIGTVNTAFMASGSAFVTAPGSAPDQQSGGVWVRTVGGTVTTDANSVFSGSGTLSSIAPGGAPIPIKPDDMSCQVKVEQNFTGFQAGHDIAVLNTGDWGANWHFGVLAGYIGASAKDLTPGASNLNANFDAPFAGLYTAFTRGNFFADAQARLDFYQGEFLGERLDAHGYSVTGNAGYRLNLGGKWELEPSVGGVFSRTSADSFGAYGSIDLPLAPVSPSAAVRTQLQDVESALGRASIKLGTSMALEGGQVMAYPFVSASVFHEFAGDVTATAASSGAFIDRWNNPRTYSASGTFTASRVGTYAQYSAGSAFALPGTGLLSYIRADYRIGDNIEGVSVLGGLRYQLNPEEAGWKDGGSLKDEYIGGYYWAGPYLGASIGSTWGNTHWDYQGNTPDPDYAGRLVSGQAGYNFQRGKLVWGVEGDFGVTNARGATLHSATQAGGVISYKDDIGGLGSVTGRLGYTWGRALFYGKGGLAFAEVQAGVHTSGPALTAAGEPVTAETLATNWEAGWTAGGGMEFALSDKWSAKAEYMHYELGKEMFNLGADNASISTSGELVQVGVNYHLGR